MHHTECALWWPRTPGHHVKLDTEHVEYAAVVGKRKKTSLPVNKNICMSPYSPTPLNVNKIITIRLTLISKVVT